MTNQNPTEKWEDEFDLMIAQAAPFTLMELYKDADFTRIKSFIRRVAQEQREVGKQMVMKAVEATPGRNYEDPKYQVLGKNERAFAHCATVHFNDAKMMCLEAARGVDVSEPKI